MRVRRTRWKTLQQHVTCGGGAVFSCCCVWFGKKTRITSPNHGDKAQQTKSSTTSHHPINPFAHPVPYCASHNKTSSNQHQPLSRPIPPQLVHPPTHTRPSPPTPAEPLSHPHRLSPLPSFSSAAAAAATAAGDGCSAIGGPGAGSCWWDGGGGFVDALRRFFRRCIPASILT